MNRRGNCYDNALPGTTHAESFWSRLKTELLDGGSFRNLTEARLEISHYLAPNHFETQFQTTSQLCAA